MVMGAGKTTVVAPLLALCLADGDSLVTAVAPRALVEMTRDVYRSTFSSPVCLKPVFTFSFARTSTVDDALVRRLQFCRDAGGVVVAAPSDVKAFVLKFAELNHETYLAAKKQTVAGKEKKSIVGQISGALTGAEGKRAKRLEMQAQARSAEAKRFVEAYGVLRKGCALLDEVDMLLHPLKSELNWPLGGEEPLDMTTSSPGCQISTTGARWRLPWFLIDACLRASGAPAGVIDADDDDAAARERLQAAVQKGSATKALQRTPHLVVVDRHFYASEMLEPLTALAAAFLRSEGVVGSSLSAQDAASYVSASPSPQALSAVGRLGDIECKYLNLAQQWLQTYLPWVLSKVNRVSYGTLAPEELRARESRGRKLLAVPFIGKDVPSEASEYSQPEVAIGLTILALRHEGMRRDAVAAMLRGLRDDFAQQHGVSSKRPAALAYKELVESAGGRVRGDVNSRRDSDASPDMPLLAEPINDDERDIWQRLWPLNSLDVRDPAQVDALARLLHKAPRAAFRYLDQHAFPTALVVRASKLSASGQALGGSLLFEKRLGFSGTPNDLLPEELGEAAFAAGDDLCGN